jgi:hypothetical protein
MVVLINLKKQFYRKLVGHLRGEVVTFSHREDGKIVTNLSWYPIGHFATKKMLVVLCMFMAQIQTWYHGPKINILNYPTRGKYQPAKISKKNKQVWY